MIFQLASNVGSGGLNVPGLQAAGLIGVQIIRRYQGKHHRLFLLFWGDRIYLQKFKSNKQDAEDLVTRISKLIELILNAFQNKTMQDIDPNLAEDLLRFQ